MLEPRLILILLAVNLVVGVLVTERFQRDDFPVDFVFGSGTSAYQVNYLYFPSMPNPCSFVINYN